MKALSRTVGSLLAGLAALASCDSGEPVDQETAAGGRIANEGGRDASEGGRARTTGGVAGRSSGGSRPTGSGGSSGDRPGGESGDPGGFPGEDPSAGASGVVDPDGGSPNGGGDPSGGTPSGGAPTGGRPSGGEPSGGTPSGGAPTGGRPSGGFPGVEGCESGRFWDPAGSDGLAPEGPWMNPGRMCIRCHEEQTGGNVVEIGGTVYPSFEEQDLCYGVDGVSLNAEVVVTDREGEVFRLPVGPNGNFSLLLEGAPRVQLPLSAKLVVGNRERVMTYTPGVGDCNYCHTKEGANGAPGRIVLPE